MQKYTEKYKVRTIRLSDKIWRRFNELKQRDKTWELFFKELMDIIDFIKKL